MTQPQPKKSDLPVRAVSAVVMVAVAGTALWLGGWVWMLFVALVALGVLWEWWGLIGPVHSGVFARTAWLLSGIVYIGLASSTLIVFRSPGADNGLQSLLMIVLGVIGTDVGAYFAGRTFGGPKIAPKISPSKTWSGLFGGILGAGAMVGIVSVAWATGLCNLAFPRVDKFSFDGPCSFVGLPPLQILAIKLVVAGVFVAITAQTGDFFESWMKRRAGVKDSGNLIPGHGGLFDRVDGLLAVCFVLGLLSLPSLLSGQ